MFGYSSSGGLDCQALPPPAPRRDLGNGVVGQLRTERAGQVRLDIADRHPARAQADLKHPRRRSPEPGRPNKKDLLPRETPLPGVHPRTNEGLVAVEHAMIITAWNMLTNREFYRDPGADHSPTTTQQETKARAVKVLEALGYDVTLQPTAGRIATHLNDRGASSRGGRSLHQPRWSPSCGHLNFRVSHHSRSGLRCWVGRVKESRCGLRCWVGRDTPGAL